MALTAHPEAWDIVMLDLLSERVRLVSMLEKLNEDRAMLSFEALEVRNQLANVDLAVTALRAVSEDHPSR
jgi:hypothetical protein